MPAALTDEAGLTIVCILVSVAALGWWGWQAHWQPVETGERYGAAAVAFFGLGTWLALLSLISGNGPFLKQTLSPQLHRWLGPRLGRSCEPAYDLPLVPTLIVLAVVLAWLRPINPVRTIDPAVCRGGPGPATGAACDPTKREEVAKAAVHWAGLQPEPDQMSGAPRPMVFVATAGGGLRAAYWTAAVLGQLADERPAFKHRLFAISGVSGGSVGALGFAALVRLEWDHQKPDGSYRELLGRAYSRDLLAPTLAAFLFDDPVRGIRWGRPHGGRGTALESGFKSAWSRAMGLREDSPMDGPFLALWSRPEKGWVPALFLNSTHLETGRRVIAASLKVEVEPFTDAWDLHDLLGADVYATVAAHNSARFGSG